MTQPVEHTDVGAYALGLLEEEDRAAFEVHLDTCARCRAELDDLGDMRSLFDGIDAEAFTAAPEYVGAVVTAVPPARIGLDPLGPAAEPESGPSPARAPAPAAAAPPAAGTAVTDLGAARRARDSRRRRASAVLGAAAAAAALVVAGVAIGGGFAPSDGASGMTAAEHILETGERHPASGFVTGTGTARARVALEEKGWGSHVGLELHGVNGPLRCDLVAVGKDGGREVIGHWTVPETGYGVASNPKPLIFHGGTSIPRESLDHLEVTVEGGPTLVSIPV